MAVSGNYAALFKDVFGDIHQVVPPSSTTLKSIPFAGDMERVGNQFVEDAVLTHEQGVVYGAIGDVNPLTIATAVPADHQQAKVDAAAIIMNARVSYQHLQRSNGDRKAFGRILSPRVMNLKQSIEKKVDANTLYGRSPSGLGTLSVVSGSGTTRTWTISTATWSTGWWRGSKGVNLDIYDTTGVTKRNTNAVVTVTSVVPGSYQVLVTGNASDLTAIVATDIIFPTGAQGNESFGLDYATTLSSGTLWNINVATYDLWKGNSFPCGSARLSFGKIMDGLSLAVGKGLDGDVELHCAIPTWSTLLTDQAALRRYDASYKPDKATNGTRSLEFYGPNGGIVKIVPNTMVKEGEAFAFPTEYAKRIGSTDITNLQPGQEEMFIELQSLGGYELRNYYEGAFYCPRPGYLVKWTDIVNT